MFENVILLEDKFDTNQKKWTFKALLNVILLKCKLKEFSELT